MEYNTNVGPPKKRSSWRSYLQWMQVYEELIVRTIDFISWWSSSSSSSDNNNKHHHDSQHVPSQWREVVWTLIHLHRLGVNVGIHHFDDDVEKQNEQLLDSSNQIKDTGMTILLLQRSKSINWEEWIRICLSAIQCIWPLVVDVVPSPPPPPSSSGGLQRHNNNNNNSRRRTTAVVILERIRFVLRTAIIVNHWRILSRDYPDILPGLLRKGGEVTFGDHVTSMNCGRGTGNTTLLTADAERSRISRLEYRGTRTGRRVTLETPTRPTPKVELSLAGSNLFLQKVKILFGELLYVARPLFQAEAHFNMETTLLSGKGFYDDSQLQVQKWKVWIISLLMDVISLGSLRSVRSMSSISFARECKRRQMRLFLYLLRSPVWEGHSLRVLDATSAVIEYVPLLGRIVSNYLWDWIYYYKLYRTEAG